MLTEISNPYEIAPTPQHEASEKDPYSAELAKIAGADMGESAVAQTVTIENPKKATWLQRTENARHVESSIASPNWAPPIGNIETTGFQKGYAITEIPTALPVGWRESKNALDAVTTKNWADMDTSERELYTDYPETGDEIAFDDLKPEVKQTMLAHQAFEIQTTSKDPESIARASERNRLRVESGAIFDKSDLTHSTNSDILSKILTEGLLAGELIADKPKSDRYAFNLDLGVLPEGFDDPEKSYDDKMGSVHNYGDIALVVEHSEGSLAQKHQVHGNSSLNESHALVFAGLPSTEIKAICVFPSLKNSFEAQSLHDARQSLLSTIDKVLEHGQYIPVIDYEGNLALTYEEFENLRTTVSYGDFVKEPYIQPEEDKIPIPGMDLGAF